LGAAPLSRTLLGRPVVLFRDAAGRPAALLDRCAHRNVPLSRGRVCEGQVECPYHGWRYNAEGDCTLVPGRSGAQEPRPRLVPSFPARERDGFVWVWASSDAPPAAEPFALAPEQDVAVVRRAVEVKAPLLAACENALDVPHTAFLHRGLFRGTGSRHRIKVVVTRSAAGVQAEYLGEPRPEGWAGKILAPAGAAVVHFDRFFLPGIAQVEYRWGDRSFFQVTSFCTPVEDDLTRMHAVIRFRTRLPAWLVRLFLEPIGERIFRQDAEILELQTSNVRRHGGESFVSTELDVLGAQMARLLRRAERAEAGAAPADDDAEGDEGWRREIEMDV
jgi:phenylpropionate dioxygenase-like ring-hydroxylating dioxygenase large terminal subunit